MAGAGVTNATGGTFTLTYNGQTTAPIAYNATAAAIEPALLEAAATSTRTTCRSTAANNVSTTNQVVDFPGDRENVRRWRQRLRADRHAA